ncbi:MAG: hypothetical protein IJR68_05755 [Fretibacterium sp.]|jgi:sterol desaturase/sphingolipid hydroxylase (fatty acid hydroxylase superfamily)|nr:hypothetical protein [Fretibacterium sp.]
MRLFITTLSLLSVIAFGYALAGYGRTLFGQPAKMDYILLGLLAGFVCSGLALWLWHRNRDKFFEEE